MALPSLRHLRGLKKTSWFYQCIVLRLSTKGQVGVTKLQSPQHTPKQAKKNTHIKSIENRYQSQRIFNVQNVQYAINLRYKTPKATTKARHHVI